MGDTHLDTPVPVRKISYQQQHDSSDHESSHKKTKSSDRNRKPSHVNKTTEKSRRISQYSKDVLNTGHSKHHDDDSHDRSEKHRRISHYNKDGSVKRGRAGSRREHDRYSVATSVDIHPAVELENTYRMEPGYAFRPEQVRSLIKDSLTDHLKNQSYDSTLMASRCMLLSDEIKEKVRQLNLPRHKIICLVMIGEKRDQSMLVSSRCIWSQEHDNFASCEYKKDNLYAVATVYAVYQE